MNKYLSITKNTTLKKLSDMVGSKNVDDILVANGIKRTVNVGKALIDKQDVIKSTSGPVTWQDKAKILNTVVQSSDVFEELSLLGDDAWKVVKQTTGIPGRMTIPEHIEVPDYAEILGNGVSVPKTTYTKAMRQLSTYPHIIDSSIFNDVDTSVGVVADQNLRTNGDINAFEWANVPWGSVLLYSSLVDDIAQFPVYPEEYDDGVTANYTSMPDILYQYEPWDTYTSSGPRENTFSFHFHRDMWTGDHRDGMANQLIRFCEANCFPDYQGSAVNTSLVTLVVNGSPLIRGTLRNCKTYWSGPLGLDGWYLECKLELTIREVSQTPLNYTSVRKKGLIG